MSREPSPTIPMSRAKRLFMEWAVGKQGEMMRPTPAGYAPGIDILFGHALSRRRRRHHRSRGTRHLFLPEGPGAEVS